jgi:hypothetical protein
MRRHSLDIEAPSPGDTIGERTTKQWSRNRGNTPDHAKHTENKRSLRQWDYSESAWRCSQDHTQNDLPVTEMMTMAPEKIPATPIPAMARPTIKTVLDGATAQMSDPISKIKTAIRKPHLTYTVSPISNDPAVSTLSTGGTQH